MVKKSGLGFAKGFAPKAQPQRGCPHSPKVTEAKYALPSEVALARITDNFGYFYKIEMHPFILWGNEKFGLNYP